MRPGRYARTGLYRSANSNRVGGFLVESSKTFEQGNWSELKEYPQPVTNSVQKDGLLFDVAPAKPPKKKRDPLLDNAAVKAYREVVHFWPNHIQRELISSMVDTESKRAMGLWEITVTEFMEQGRNPKDVQAMLKKFLILVRT